MVYTLTFNPAIDYVMQVNDFKTGQISRSESEGIYFGGKGINVSLILAELGVESVALGFIAGFTGEALEKGIASRLITPDFVKLENGLTRINVKLRSSEETDINANGPAIGEDDLQRLFKKLEALKSGDILVLAGSIPATLPKNMYEQIMARTIGKNVRFVVDAERDLLVTSLKYKPFLIKPNAEELGEIFNVKIDSPKLALKYAAELKKLGARNVIVSMGSDGAVLLSEDGDEHYEKPFRGEQVNSVGAGDSMLAGFLAGYIREKDCAKALRLGSAAGAATAFSEGLAAAGQIYSLL